MTREQLDAIRARVEAATPGPWRASRWPSNNPSVAEAWGLSGMVTFSDAAFCGHAREDVPALLAEVERLTADPLPAAAWVREVERAAFQRGVAAMREAAAKECRPILRSMVSRSELADAIRALPDPEDK